MKRNPYKIQMHDLPETLPPPSSPYKSKRGSCYGPQFYMSISLPCSQIPLSPALPKSLKMHKGKLLQAFSEAFLFNALKSLQSLFKVSVPVILSF